MEYDRQMMDGLAPFDSKTATPYSEIIYNPKSSRLKAAEQNDDDEEEVSEEIQETLHSPSSTKPWSLWIKVLIVIAVATPGDRECCEQQYEASDDQLVTHVPSLLVQYEYETPKAAVTPVR